MTNFRQFAGEQTLRFASDDQRNITVIFGANGAGKTTILNAFVWTLFGEFTPDLEHPERLINDSVWAEAKSGEIVEASCDVAFEHAGCFYSASRKVEARAGADEPQTVDPSGTLTLMIRDASGETLPSHNPKDVIDQILPHRLHQFFFFNGERIERLAQESAFEEIEEATKTLLGLEVLERAERHLDKAAISFEKELAVVGSDEARGIASELESAREQQGKLRDEKEEAAREEKGCDELRIAVEEELRSLEGAKVLQDRRDDLERELSRSRDRVKQLRQERNGQLARRGFQALLGSLGADVEKRIGDLESSGELPAPYKESFIDDLLQKGECICGAPLESGESGYEQVVAYREKAGAGETEQALIAIKTHAGYVDSQRLETNRVVMDLTQQLGESSASVAQCEERLSEISRELSGLPSEEIGRLEARHRELVEKGKEAAAKRSKAVHEFERCGERLKDLEKELAAVEARDERAALAQSRATVARRLSSLAASIYGLFQESVRSRLDEKIKETFRSISYKEREPELNERFELRLWDTSGNKKIASIKSTGENQILSLSFVGGLASLAREFEQEGEGSTAVDSLLRGQGGIYPVVVDAAFGNLDSDYRQDVARALPRLAPQAVILVSKAQASGEVLSELKDFIGAAYSITYYTTKADEDDDVTFDGRSYPYRRSITDGLERAEVCRLDESPTSK